MTDTGFTSRVPIVLRLGEQTFFVLLGNLFTLAVGLPLQIYVSRVLGAHFLGIFSLIEAGILTIGGLLGLGISQTLVRFIPVHLEHREYGKIRALVGTGSLILLCVGVTAYLIVLANLVWLDTVWPELAPHKSAIALMGAMIPIGLLTFMVQQGLRGLQEIPYMVLGSSVVQLTAKAITTVIAFGLGFGMHGYIVATLLSTLTAFLWMGYGVCRKLGSLPLQSPSMTNESRAEWSRYATTSYTYSLVSTATLHLDRFLLGLLAGPAPVGVLLVVKQLQQIPAMFLNMLLVVAAPMFSTAHARGDRDSAAFLYHLSTDWMFRAASPLLLFICLFAEELLQLFGREFATSGKHALWIFLAAQAINLAFGPIGSLLMMSGLERAALRLTAYQTVAFAVGSILLIPKFGLAGVAVSVAIGTIFANLAAFLSARKYLKLRWWDSRYLKWGLPLALATVAGLGMRAFAGAGGLPVVLLGGLAIMYLTALSTSLLQGLNNDDKELLRHFFTAFR